MYFSDNLSKGNTIYQDISQYPFIPGLYSPVYPLVVSLPVKIFGLSYVTGRVVSIIAALLIGIVLYKIVRLKARRLISLVAPLLFFASSYIFNWSVLYRVDVLGLLFCLIGVFIILKYENRRLVYLSIPFFLLAVFTKQSYLVAPAASFIYLAFRSKMLAAKFGVMFGGLLVLLFLLGNYLTNGQLYLHLITYQNLSPVLDWTIKRYSEFLVVHAVIFILSLSFAIYGIIRKRHLLLAIYFIIAAIAATTVGRPGAAGNYFLELIALCCVLIVLLIMELEQYINKGSLAGILISTGLVLQLFLFVHLPVENLTRDMQANRELSALIKSTPGDILSEDAGMVVTNGKTLFVEWRIYNKWDCGTSRLS